MSAEKLYLAIIIITVIVMLITVIILLINCYCYYYEMLYMPINPKMAARGVRNVNSTSKYSKKTYFIMLRRITVANYH